MSIPDLIYDWNQNYPREMKPSGPVLLNDETLRDGLQSPSVRDPSIAEKIEILHLMEALGIHSRAVLRRAENRPADRSRDLHRIEPNPPLCRKLD